MNDIKISMHEAFTRLFKYIINGLIVFAAVYLLPTPNKRNINQAILVGIISSTVFSLSELIYPSVGSNISANMTFYPGILPINMNML